MTVGIGVLAEAGKLVIIASDTRATFPRSNVAPNDECGKQWHLLPFPCTAAAAGLLRVAQPLVDELSHQLIRLGNPKRRRVYQDHIRHAIDRARYLVFRRTVDWSMKTTYCMSLSQWRAGKVASGKLDWFLFNAGKALIASEARSFGVEMIVGGYLWNNQLVFYKASGTKQIEQSTAPGVYVIGSGGQAAMDHLNVRGQHLDCSLARSLLHVAEALEVSRRKNPSTVGQPSHLVITWKGGEMMRFDPFCPVMANLKRTYKNRRSTESVDEWQGIDQEIRSQMIRHEPR